MREIRFHRAVGRWACLATRSPHPIRLDGEHWPTVEHYMLAQRFSGDETVLGTIRDCLSVTTAARVAVRERRHVREDWPDVRDAIMYRAQLAKFTQHPELADRLLETGHAMLVEHVHGDAYWGDDGDGSGENMLGRTLMAVREELRRSRVEAGTRE